MSDIFLVIACLAIFACFLYARSIETPDEIERKAKIRADRKRFHEYEAKRVQDWLTNATPKELAARRKSRRAEWWRSMFIGVLLFGFLGGITTLITWLTNPEWQAIFPYVP